MLEKVPPRFEESNLDVEGFFSTPHTCNYFCNAFIHALNLLVGELLK